MDHKSSLENSLNHLAQTTKSPKPEEDNLDDIDVEVDFMILKSY